MKEALEVLRERVEALRAAGDQAGAERISAQIGEIILAIYGQADECYAERSSLLPCEGPLEFLAESDSPGIAYWTCMAHRPAAER